MKDLLDKVESFRKERKLSNEVARLASFILLAENEDVDAASSIMAAIMVSPAFLESKRGLPDPSQEIQDLDVAIYERLDHSYCQDEQKMIFFRNLFWDFTAPQMQDYAILLNRQVCQGADPLSMVLATGLFTEWEAEIRQAHVEGPGFLTGRPRSVWLFLASCSADEANSESVSVEDRHAHFNECVVKVIKGYSDLAFFDEEVAEKENEIMGLPFDTKEVGGVLMPVYRSDLGFAAAYWRGAACAAVEATGCTMVGCRAPYNLEGLNIKVSKSLSPSFGLIFGS